MFDPEFSIIVNNLVASKYIINDEETSAEYKNMHLKSFNDTLKYFYYEDINDKMLDLLYHDAYRLVMESSNDITPSLDKDGWVDAVVSKDESNLDSVYGHMTKRIANDGNEYGINLSYNKGNISRNYGFYEDSILMYAIINGKSYTKVTRLNNEGVYEYAIFENTEDKKIFILSTDEYNVQDVIKCYIDSNKNEDIKLLFPELYERCDKAISSRTRK